MNHRTPSLPISSYTRLYKNVYTLLQQAKKHTYQVVNTVLTTTYWHIGKQIVEFEQKGQKRARYGEKVLKQLAKDLTSTFGKGLGYSNLNLFRQFYLTYYDRQPILQTAIGESNDQIDQFNLSWTHYVKLLPLKENDKRLFYENEANRARWSVRHLDRQINSALYERSLLPKSKKKLYKSHYSKDYEITFKDPYILEFLNLPETHSEKDLESSLIIHMSDFLLELGLGFTFVARQKRLQIGSESYYIDLLMYHRQLRCFVVIDLKIGKISHADIGQMNLYLNYLKENDCQPDENPPIGLILCTEKDDAVVHYAIGGLSNKVFASRYKLMLPKPRILEKELKKECLHIKNRLIK